MELDQVDKGFLEKEIDRTVENVKSTIEMARNEEYRKFTQIINESDFVFGWSLDQIVQGFTYFFLIRHGRHLTESESNEVVSRVNTRSNEIKDAILSCG